MQQTGIVKKTNCAVQAADANVHSLKNHSFDPSSVCNGKEDICAAEVEIIRSSACGENCSSCGLCPGMTARIYAVNDINAAVGDEVIINMSDKNVLGAAFLVYIVPLITLIIGYFLGYTVFGSDGFAVLTGFILMAITFILLICTDRKLKRKYTPHIVRIVDKAA